MIREDRLKLNERFINVFSLLQERGDVVLNDRSGKGMGDFAEKVLGNKAYGHIIRAFLNSDDKRVLDYRHARTVCREYGVNESYLIDGIGTPFGFDLPSNKGEVNVSKGNILFTSVQAFAGTTVEDAGSFAPSEEYNYFSLPGLSGSGLVAFPIEGNSMDPVIKDNDIIICKELSSLHEISENDIYTVKNNGSLWVKYIRKIQDSNGRISQLKLISANHLEYDPFIEDVSEHTRLYKVVRRISQL